MILIVAVVFRQTDWNVNAYESLGLVLRYGISAFSDINQAKNNFFASLLDFTNIAVSSTNSGFT